MYSSVWVPDRKRLLIAAAFSIAGLIAAVAFWAVQNLSFTLVAFAGVALIFPFAFALAPERRLWFIAGMLLATPLNIDQTFMLHPSPGGADGLLLSVTDLFMIILLIVTLSRSSRLKRTGGLRFYPAILLPSLAMFLMSIVSTLNARDLWWSSFDLLSMAKTLLSFWLLANNIRSRRDLDVVLLSMFAAMVMQTVLAALMTFRPATVELMASIKLGVSKELLESKDYFSEYYRAGGSIGNANHLARYFGMILPLAVVVALTDERRMMRTAAAVSALVGALGIIATMARSAWIGLVLSIAVMLPLMLFHRLMTLRTLLRIGAAAFAGVMIFVIFSGTIIERMTNNDNGSAQTRITTSKVALRIIKDHPLIGCGINNYGALLPEYWLGEDVFTRKAPVHNNYLMYAAEIGLLGLGAYLWLLIAASARTVRALRSRISYHSAVAVGVAASLAAYLVEALSDKSYKESYTLLLTFWALLAIVEAVNRLNAESYRGL